MPSPPQTTMSHSGAAYDVGSEPTVSQIAPRDGLRPKFFPNKGAPSPGLVPLPSSSAAASSSSFGPPVQQIRPR
eukprot:2424094-Prorocentrum_lima.AAC.1